MHWKQVFPFAGLGVLVLGILALFYATRERDDEVVQRLILDKVRAQMTAQQLVEGRDFSVGEIALFQRKGALAIASVELRSAAGATPFFYRVRQGDRGWTIEADLADEFRAAAGTPQFTNEMQVRLGRHLAERMRMEVRVDSGGEAFVFTLRREGDDVFASCHSYFQIHRTDRPEKIQYIEDFRYTDGAWVIAYQGRILQSIR